ncbi:inverse autotransporter beta domain-containing protein, partial [Pelagibacteraceae bacterium]|nr:inverse autotransporter beta domain-containing protein [Pelagibacteraceae bacterium]
MKFIKIFLTSLCLIITTVANADVASQALNKVSEKISNLIPGEGITELNLGLSDADDNDPTINLLILRNLNKTDDSNLFTQFSLQTQDVGQNDLRYIGNLGMGYRFLNDDRSLMLGGNIFYDRDFENEH